MDQFTLDLKDHSALVTGGASGIGRACARRLARAGATVTVIDLDGPAANAVAEEIAGKAVQCDLSDTASLAEMEFAFDIVINNAGFQHVDPIEQFPADTFAKMLRVMLEAPFLIVRAVLPHMYTKGFGRIVNISSVHGLRASLYKSAYVAAKHGLEGLSKVIALEGAPHGVTSNTVCPGFARTPIVEKQVAELARLHGIDPEAVTTEILLHQSAIKRLAEPEEVAELVAYLCGSAASFATGGSYVLDGGWSAR